MARSTAEIRRRFRELSPALDERSRRLFVAAEARAYGYGGVSVVSRVTGIARSTIARGMAESRKRPRADSGRIRKRGGGRKAKLADDAALLPDLECLVEPATRGDPMRIVAAGRRKVCDICHRRCRSAGHSVCPHVVADCLRELGYSLQANRKTREGSGHVDRDAQFQYISDQAGGVSGGG